MKIEFFAPMKKVPTTTHQMKAVRVVNGKPQFYEPEKVAETRAKLSTAVGTHRPAKPLQGAVQLQVKWCFPATKTHPNGTYKTSKPDTDNLQKMLKDVMTTNGFWKDDAQVACEVVEKFWAEFPGIYIAVEELP